MYACCQRKDPKALTDYNLIESPRDQSRPLPLDLYTETASDDRKSFLRKACRPYSSTALESMRSVSPYLFILPLFFSFILPVDCVFLFINCFTPSHIRACSKHASSSPTSSTRIVYLEKLHSFLTGCLPFIDLNLFFPSTSQFFLLRHTHVLYSLDLLRLLDLHAQIMYSPGMLNKIA